MKFPEGLRTIGKDAFSGCGQLSAAAFPDSLMSVGAGAFASCGFHSLHLENTSLAVIPEKCFGWCSGLQKLAFAECRALTRLIVPENTLTVESPFSSFTGGERRSIAVIGMNTKLVDICGLTISGALFGGKPMVQNLTVYCLPDSAAQRYCLDNGVPCRHLSEFPAE